MAKLKLSDKQFELLDDFTYFYSTIEAEAQETVDRVKGLSDLVQEFDTLLDTIEEDYTDDMREYINFWCGTDNLQILRQHLLGNAMGWLKRFDNNKE